MRLFGTGIISVIMESNAEHDVHKLERSEISLAYHSYQLFAHGTMLDSISYSFHWSTLVELMRMTWG